MRQMRQERTHPTRLLGQVRHEIAAAARHAVVALLVAVIGGALLVEVGEVVMTGQMPTVVTHITAAFVALVLGYAVAVTVLFRALLRGIGRGAEWVTDEFEEVTRRILHDDGKEPQEATQRVAMSGVGDSSPAAHTATLDDGLLAGFHAE